MKQRPKSHAIDRGAGETTPQGQSRTETRKYLRSYEAGWLDRLPGKNTETPEEAEIGEQPDEPVILPFPGLRRAGLSDTDLEMLGAIVLLECAADLARLWGVNPGTASRRKARLFGLARAAFLAVRVLDSAEEGCQVLDPKVGRPCPWVETAGLRPITRPCRCAWELQSLTRTISRLLASTDHPAPLLCVRREEAGGRLWLAVDGATGELAVLRLPPSDCPDAQDLLCPLAA